MKQVRIYPGKKFAYSLLLIFSSFSNILSIAEDVNGQSQTITTEIPEEKGAR